MIYTFEYCIKFLIRFIQTTKQITIIMKPKSFFTAFLIFSLSIIISCKKDQTTDSNSSNNNGDNIKILSVSPTSGLTNGQQVDFTVKVSYNLVSKQTGTLMIGFNNGADFVSAYMISNANKIINSGSGQHTFNVTTTVKNWGSLGDFFVYVNLSENPIPSSWMPFATDRYTLIPKK